MLHVGDAVPHFEVTDVTGRPVRYAAIWQVRPLALVCLPSDQTGGTNDYVARVTAQVADASDDAAWVLTRDPVAGLEAPAVLVADQWGEVVYAAAATSVEDLPHPKELLDWLQFLSVRCPECEGETR